MKDYSEIVDGISVWLGSVADILAKEFPEKIQKKEILKIVLDEELKELLEQAKKLASEFDATKRHTSRSITSAPTPWAGAVAI
ncbi:MAG: hypothetical protein HYZ71_11460 [Deltaproteobacteria bacterium]|nr:hypothetical protein [Deltaproteobacteria bacterium]